MIFLNESESVQVFFLSFVYICIAVGDQIIKREGKIVIPFTDLIPKILLVPVLSQDLDFQHNMSLSFLCSVS